MALHSLDLGQLGLLSTTSGLQVQVTSSIQLAASEESHDSLQTLDAFAGSRTRQMWTTLAAGFDIAVELHLPDDRLTYRHDFAETLAQTLFDAPFWKQLQLEPKAKVISVRRSGSSVQFQISFDHAASEKSSLSRRAHKLAQEVPYQDIDPPSGIRTTLIHHVSLHMRFSTTDNHKRGKVSASPVVENDKDDEMLDFYANSPELPAPCEPQTATRIRRTNTTPERSKPSTSRISLLRPGGEVRIGCQEYCSPTLKRCHSARDIDDQSENRHVGDVFTLFDAGLRYAIATPSKRLLKNVEVIGHESLKQLSSVCPAVFSPAHLESVSSRTVFLPTVSHALTQLCGVHARNPALRSKLLELSRRCGMHRSEHRTSPTTQDNMSAHLWRSMQAGLFDSNAASRLTPISSGAPDMSQVTSGAQPAQLEEAEVGGCDEAGLDDCDYDFDDENLFESEESKEWDQILTETTSESTQEHLFEAHTDRCVDDMLLG